MLLTHLKGLSGPLIIDKMSKISLRSSTEFLHTSSATKYIKNVWIIFAIACYFHVNRLYSEKLQFCMELYNVVHRRLTSGSCSFHHQHSSLPLYSSCLTLLSFASLLRALALCVSSWMCYKPHLSHIWDILVSTFHGHFWHACSNYIFLWSQNCRFHNCTQCRHVPSLCASAFVSSCCIQNHICYIST